MRLNVLRAIYTNALIENSVDLLSKLQNNPPGNLNTTVKHEVPSRFCQQSGDA